MLTIFPPFDLVVSISGNSGQLSHNLVGDSLFSLDILSVSPILKKGNRYDCARSHLRDTLATNCIQQTILIRAIS